MDDNPGLIRSRALALMAALVAAFLLPSVAVSQQMSPCISHHRAHIIEFVDAAQIRFDDAHQMVMDYRDEVISLLPADQQALYYALPEHFNTGYPRAADVRALALQQQALYPVGQYPEIYWLWQHVFRTSNYDLYYRRQTEKMQEYRADVLSGERLLDIRTPFHSSGRNGKIESVHWQLVINIPEKLTRLTKEGPQPNPTLLADAIHMTLQAAEKASWALWHHADATFDEEYHDPDFGMCWMGGM